MSKIFLWLSLLFIWFFTFPKVYAQTCTTCPNGTYSCAGGTMCCRGEGCPSATNCGECSVGWTGGDIWTCEDGTDGRDCPNTCQSCSGSGNSGSCPSSCQRGPSCGAGKSAGSGCGNCGTDQFGDPKICCKPNSCGSPPPPPPPPPPSGFIHGRVWEDYNGNGTIEVPNEVWGQVTNGSCNTRVSSILNVSYLNTNATFNCAVPSTGTLFTGKTANTPYNTNVTINLPKNHFCSQTSWGVTICNNASCSSKSVTSGSGCSAALTGVKQYSNPFTWKIVTDTPPTGRIIAPVPTADHIMADGTLVLDRSIAQSFTGIGNSADSDLSALRMAYRPYDPNTDLDADPATVFSANNVTGATATVTRNLTIPSGYYSYFVQVNEAVGNYCTGKYSIDAATENRCDRDSNAATTDRVAIFGDTIPVCGKTYGGYTWPTTMAAPNTTMIFSSNAAEIDHTTVKYSWAATDASGNACGRYPDLKLVRVNAIGRNVGTNRPRMSLIISRAGGGRTIYGPVTTTSASALNYDFNVNVNGATMIEIAYDNDYTSGSNSTSLEINTVALYENASGAPLITLNPGAVNVSPAFYDRANIATNDTTSGVSADYYDGVDSAGTAAAVNGGNLGANGILRFPSVFISPTTMNSTCTVSLTPLANNPLYYDGNACTQAFTVTPRIVTGNILDLTSAGSVATCTSSVKITDTNGTAAQAQLYNSSTAVGSPASIASGTYTINDVNDRTVFNSLCINGPVGDGNKLYSYACYNSPQLTCTKGSGNCLVSCTPTNALSTGNVVLTLGFTGVTNDKWFTALDGDIYSSNVSAYVATTPLGGFTSSIINTETASSLGGYGFAGGVIDTQTPGSKTSEKGGDSTLLNSFGTYNFEDKWLNDFSFAAPAGALTSVSGTAFADGKVYNLTSVQMNSILNNNTYTVTGGTGTDPKVAIVFVPGTSPINITKAFNAGGTNQMLVLVTQAPVVVSDTLKVPTLAGFTVTSGSQLDMVILSKDSITFNSKFNQSSSTFDDPVVVNGSLISRNVIDLKRNLGGANNTSYPAESVRFNSSLLYRLTQLEMIATGVNSVGISKFDLQWDYGN